MNFPEVMTNVYFIAENVIIKDNYAQDKIGCPDVHIFQDKYENFIAKYTPS